MAIGTQQRLSKVRKPRVHITYDVLIDGSPVEKELPLVVGVFSDLFGQNEEREPLKERKFIKLEERNFDQTLAKIAPKLSFSINTKPKTEPGKEPTLAEKAASTVDVEFVFRSMEDFNPDHFIKQNRLLAPLFKTRKLLMDMISVLDGNDRLLYILLETVKAGKIGELKLPAPAAPAATPAAAPATPVSGSAAGSTPAPALKPTDKGGSSQKP